MSSANGLQSMLDDAREAFEVVRGLAVQAFDAIGNPGTVARAEVLRLLVQAHADYQATVQACAQAWGDACGCPASGPEPVEIPLGDDQPDGGGLVWRGYGQYWRCYRDGSAERVYRIAPEGVGDACRLRGRGIDAGGVVLPSVEAAKAKAGDTWQRLVGAP
jgi:hypothetical protein